MSLVGFRAKNHPQQAVRDDVDDRRTPRDFFDPLNAKHAFTVDVAASAGNTLLPRFYTREDDGLAQSWAAERVWCNPPYSNLYAWVEKAWVELASGCESVTMLVPANRCEQKWWQQLVEPFRDRHSCARASCKNLRVDFLPGRMRFDWPAGRVVPAKGDRPPFGLALLTWERAA